MDTPLIIRIEEARQEMTQYVGEILQKYGLNCYLIEPSFAELYAQVKATAQQELAQAKAQMEAAQAASDNTK